MLVLILFAAIAVTADGMVCFHGICDTLEKRPPLQCKGGIIPKGGFCQCFDVCAKVEDELCETRPIRGRESLGTCDKGLTCQPEEHMIIGAGRCVKIKDNSSVKRLSMGTVCQTLHVFAHPGQNWIPECDNDFFLQQQCDSTHTCFCVDPITGEVDESTKVLGSLANCGPSATPPTLCQQRRYSALISMAVDKGQWIPKCGAYGYFQSWQCDNTCTCFNVDAYTGVVNETTKVNEFANCAVPVG